MGAHTFAGVEPQSTENCRTDSGGYGAGWRKSGDCAGRRSLSGGAVDGYEHDLTLSGWATDSNDPDSFFRPLLSCAAIHSQTNLAHWCDPKFDSVLRKALSSQQLAARIEAYDEAQSILAQELPILPLASSLRLQAYRYDIKGLVLSPFGNASFAGVYREKQDEVKKP